MEKDATLIIKDICLFFNEDYLLVASNNRKINTHTSDIRGLCIYILRNNCSFSNCDCKKALNFKSIRGIKKAFSKNKYLIENQEQYKTKYNLLIQKKPYLNKF